MKILRNIIILLILIALAGVFYFSNMIKAVDVNDEEIKVVNIEENTNYREIGKKLKDEGLIKSELAFELYLRKEDSRDKLKAGSYNLSKSMNVESIVDILKEGKSVTLKFTIPEGFEMKQVIDRLVELNYADEERLTELLSDKANFEDQFEFLSYLEDGQNLEGYLYPATYEILPKESEESIISRMLAAFENVYESENLQIEAENRNLTLNELITLASIVEREAVINEERPMMAQVFYSRLENNMPLGSCATVQYIIGERKPVLSIADTQIDSPYNTYKNQGLPPYPIASPGLLSIQATLNPTDTEYLYFVLTGEDGSHTFSKTYEEHLEAEKDMIID